VPKLGFLNFDFPKCRRLELNQGALYVRYRGVGYRAMPEIP
jgi:hypothetical protein